MSVEKVKFAVSVALLGVWGPYLLLIYLRLVAVPGWAMQPSLRKAFMLARDYDATLFTLIFGLVFTGMAIYALVGLVTGRARFSA